MSLRVHVSSAAVSSPVPLSHLYGGRPPILPVTLWMLDFADKNFVLSTSQSIVVAPMENPASPPASRTSSWSLDRDAISSGDSRSSDSALRASPVSKVDPESAVMPTHSSVSDPDLVDELCQLQPLYVPAPVSASVSVGVVESPSHYPVPAEPVMLYVVSSAQVSPNQVRKERASVTLDVFPVYEVSRIRRITSRRLRRRRLHSRRARCLSRVRNLFQDLLGAPASLDSLLVYDITFLDRDIDLSLLAVPLLPLPDDLQLLPATVSEQPTDSAERYQRLVIIR